MLTHLSAKFQTAPEPAIHEPRAAIILNRFSRSLPIMFSTTAVSTILGVTPDEVKDESFYNLIQENCLPGAIRCLENAKANDSIAYLRFWYHDPRNAGAADEHMSDASSRAQSHSSDEEDGGVQLDEMDVDSHVLISQPMNAPHSSTSTSDSTGGRSYSSEQARSVDEQRDALPFASIESRTSSAISADITRDSTNSVFDHTDASRSSTSSLAAMPPPPRSRPRQQSSQSVPAVDPIEVEAVVSCTSDGLVVILRRARPLVPSPEQRVAIPQYANGLFAAPWGAQPSPPRYQAQYQPPNQEAFQHAFIPNLPDARAHPIASGGPPLDGLMASIRDVAVFAWSLTGINGNIASYGRGTPSGEAVPPAGLPMWDPLAQNIDHDSPENQAMAKWSRIGEYRMSDPADGKMVPLQRPGQRHILHQPQSQPRYDGGATGAIHAAPATQARLPVGPVSPHDGSPQSTPSQVQGPSDGEHGNRYLWY